MAEFGIEQPVDITDVETPEEAAKFKFLGSPTIRIDGLDVDKSARDRTDYSLACRIYRTGEGVQEWPSKAMIIDALEEARKSEASI